MNFPDLHNTKSNPEKLRLVISSYDDINNPYYGGGGAIATHEIAKRLASVFDVTVLTGNYPHAINGYIDGVYYHRIGSSKLGPRISQLLFHFHLQHFIRTICFDVWLEGFTPPFTTSFLPLSTPKPVIGLAHILSGEEMKRKYLLPFHLIEQLGLRFYQYVIVPSDPIKQKISRINKHSYVKTIPFGISVHNTQPTQPPTPQLLYIGRLEYGQKGLDLLLKTFSHLTKLIPHQLVIAGKGDDNSLKHIKKDIERLNLGDRVILTGKVGGIEKELLFRQASIVVIPSRFETFNLVALESLSYGKPIACFDIEGLKWIPNTSSLKSPPFDTFHLSQKIYDLLNSDTRYQQVCSSSFRFSSQFNWDSTIQQYSQFINNIYLAHIAHPLPQFNIES